MVFIILSKAARRGYGYPMFKLPQRNSSFKVSNYGSQNENFCGTLTEIIDTITRNFRFAEVPEVAHKMKKILDYNLTSGKYGRGLTTVMTYEMLEKPENVTPKSLKLAHVMGWCVEMLQAYWIVLDDIIDKSEKRRSKPCWYTLPNVGMNALNDSVLLYSCMMDLLKTNFGQLPQYFDVINIFNETLFYTAVGQNLDYIMSNQSKKDYSLFTKENYDRIVKYKCSYYTYVFPVCLGMILANKYDKDNMKKVHEISYKIGRLYQIQDDFIDVFGSESITGKIGTDIQNGKCSWLAVTALQHCKEAERELFITHYGSPNSESVEQIKMLYQHLELPSKYRKEERLHYDDIVRLAHSFEDLRDATTLFLRLLDIIFKRSK